MRSEVYHDVLKETDPGRELYLAPGVCPPMFIDVHIYKLQMIIHAHIG
ncbi:hypothetical protein QUF80_12915 [Desulfococcaceae bacterium HSG8]|nr:hypothetical protein [Desulfococcaceae bacterium HSG8]